MPGCLNLNKNLKNCSCSYGSCGRKGMCCECVDYHRRNRQIPGCFFSPDAEKTYDRSVKKFMDTAGE